MRASRLLRCWWVLLISQVLVPYGAALRWVDTEEACREQANSQKVVFEQYMTRNAATQSQNHKTERLKKYVVVFGFNLDNQKTLAVCLEHVKMSKPKPKPKPKAAPVQAPPPTLMTARVTLPQLRGNLPGWPLRASLTIATSSDPVVVPAASKG
eukprot:gene4564-5585_t